MLTMTNAWRIFESVVEQIFKKQYVNQQIRTANNVKLQGKSTVHQIDVIAEIKLDMVVLRYIIDAKDWNTNIPKEKVANIITIRDDVGAHVAIIITRKGFQQGAIELARKNGVQLLRIIVPSESGLKKAIIQNIIPKPTIVDFDIVLEPKDGRRGHAWSEDLGEENYQRANLYDKDGKVVDNWLRIVDQHISLMLKENKDKIRFNYAVDKEPIFVKSPTGEMARVLAFSFAAEIERDTTTEEVDLTKNKLLVENVTYKKMSIIDEPYNWDILLQ